MYRGRHQNNMLTPLKNKLLDCTILYPTKTLQFFRHCLWKVNLQTNHKQSSNFIQEIPWHHLTIWHFSTSKNRTNRSPGSFYHGVASFLPSCWSLRLCRLPFCQTQASFYRFFLWSILEHRNDGTVSVIYFWWWDVILGSLANNILNLYIYTL